MGGAFQEVLGGETLEVGVAPGAFCLLELGILSWGILRARVGAARARETGAKKSGAGGRSEEKVWGPGVT